MAGARADSRASSATEIRSFGDVAIAKVASVIDEHFTGFGTFDPAIKNLVIDVSQVNRITSFGVRQWLAANKHLPKSIVHQYLLGCTSTFVDQLNMVLNFGGAGEILTVRAPYRCASCGAESTVTLDVLTDRALFARGLTPRTTCKCGGVGELDDTPESYFSFLADYGASGIQPEVAQVLAAEGRYFAVDSVADKPPRILKLVHGAVTYLRIVGAIGAMFRARPMFVGAEGEVVLDLAEVERFDTTGQAEWRRLLKTLAGQVASVTLVDMPGSLLAHVTGDLQLGANIVVWSLLVPYRCLGCGRQLAESTRLVPESWPIAPPERTCSTCGGKTVSQLDASVLARIPRPSRPPPPASTDVIVRRAELLSRALTNANVAQAHQAGIAGGIKDVVLGKYQIIRPIAEGGMAEVFLAKQVGIEKPVAVKRILHERLTQRQVVVDMFLNEAKIAGRLIHPNIVQVLDIGIEEGVLSLAMEYVHGMDLRDVIKEFGALPLQHACFITAEIAQALHHAYWSMDLEGKQLSVVHRDVSPANVMLGFDGTVKLLDFGVALSAVTDHEQHVIAGKWPYMSPEHTLRKQEVDHRSDLFSVGVMLYQMCSGKLPFSGDTLHDLVHNIRSGNYTPLARMRDVPPSLAALVDALLSSYPDARPQIGRDVANRLGEIMREHKLESSSRELARWLASVRTVVAQRGDERTPTPELAKTLLAGESAVEPVDDTIIDPGEFAEHSGGEIAGAVALAPAPTPVLAPPAPHVQPAVIPAAMWTSPPLGVVPDPPRRELRRGPLAVAAMVVFIAALAIGYLLTRVLT